MNTARTSRIHTSNNSVNTSSTKEININDNSNKTFIIENKIDHVDAILKNRPLRKKPQSMCFDNNSNRNNKLLLVSANNSTTKGNNNTKLRWVNGLDWKKTNTELIFNNISKQNDNYSHKKQKLKDFQSSVNEYEYNKHSGEPNKALKGSKNYNEYKKLIPYYTEVRKVEKFSDINSKERAGITKTILTENSNPNETTGSKYKKINNTSVFQGEEFSKNYYSNTINSSKVKGKLKHTLI